jgi:hypothetical protein
LTYTNAILFPVSGDPIPMLLKSLVQVQTLVNGHVAAVKDRGRYILCNEDGHLKNLEPNTHLPDLVGNVIVTSEDVFENLPYEI